MDEESLKIYRDWYSITKTAVDKAKLEGLEEGLEKGLEKGRAEGLAEGIEKGLAEGREKESMRIAMILKGKGIDISAISDITGLRIPDIEKL